MMNVVRWFNRLWLKNRLYLRSGLIILFILTYLLKSFWQLPVLAAFMGYIAALVFFVNAMTLKPLNRNLIILLLLGSGSLIWSGPGDFDWCSAIIESAGIVTLLLTAPLLGIILYYAPYETMIFSYASRYIRTNYLYYGLVLCIVSFLSALMNLAIIPFAHQLLSPIAARYPAAILYQAIMRGYSVNLFWAPNMICVAVVLQYTHISWQELAPVGLLFAMLTFLAACSLGKYDVPHGEILQTEQSPDIPVDPSNKRYLFSLIMQVILILAILTIITRYAHKSIYVSVALVSIVVPFLFALAWGQLPVYRERLSNYLTKALPGMSNEFMLFSSMGFFAYALNQSSSIAFVQAQLLAINEYGPFMLVLAIITAITGLSMIGIHPIITISSLAIALENLHTGLTNVQLAVTLLTGYILYVLLSPFSSVVLIVSGLSRQNVYEMGLRMNGRYALVSVLVVTLAIYVWLQS